MQSFDDFAKILDLANLPKPLPSVPPPTCAFCSKSAFSLLLTWLYRSKKDIIKHWREDSLFASQYFSGVNPMVVCRVPPKDGEAGLPSDLTRPEEAWTRNRALIDQWLVKHEGPGTSVAELITGGHLFYADYKILEGLKPGIDVHVGVGRGTQSRYGLFRRWFRVLRANRASV